MAEDEGEEPMELPTEEDGTLLLTTLQAQYPGTSGLKYRNPDTSAIRGIRLHEGRLHPPTSDEGWGSQVYICVFPKGMFIKYNQFTESDWKLILYCFYVLQKINVSVMIR